MRNRIASTFFAAGLVGLALSLSCAQADTILVFSQNGTGDDFTATNNGSTAPTGARRSPRTTSRSRSPVLMRR